MEYVIGLILAFAGLFYFKNKHDKARIDLLLGKTKGKDLELKGQQEEVEKGIAEMDKGIERSRIERETKRKEQDNKTPEERAKKWDD